MEPPQPEIDGATLMGIDALLVEVEVKLLTGQMGRFLMTGLPGAAVRESRDRVRAAITASSFKFPRQSLLVHLAPGDLRKEGPLLDLPIALGILAASGQLPIKRFQRFVAAGELALDGRVRPVRGLLPIAHAARTKGVDGMLVPGECGVQAALDDGIPIYPVATLIDAVAFLVGDLEIAPASTRRSPPPQTSIQAFDDIRGQEEAKRAMVVAAAGRHNLLLVGPPGAGKTLLARRMSNLLPDLDDESSLQCTRIQSVTDPRLTDRVVRPPFRAPHHTASPASMLGGGPHLRPGEITLAHNGVLFLDEFPEFPRHVIEGLRQPLEDRVVTVSRAIGAATFPASLCLIAAMNPCPCGYRGHRRIACRCTHSEIRRYSRRISGPILDRIDLFVDVPPLDVDELLAAPLPPSITSDPAQVVRDALETQSRRFQTNTIRRNSEMTPRDLARHCRVDGDVRDLLLSASKRLELSARGVHRTLRVARTAADLRGAGEIEGVDLAFALSCRPTLSFD